MRRTMSGWPPRSCPASSWPADCTAMSSGRCWPTRWAAGRYAAALLGPGSEVLGFDTARSTDHDWGPRLQVFLDPADAERAAELTEPGSARRLPSAVAGHATAIRWDDGHVGHGVQLVELGGWLVRRLGADPRTGFGTADWLATPTQALAEVTGGAVVPRPARRAGRDPGRPWPGTRPTSGGTPWPGCGRGSPRRNRSSAAPARSATSWARPWSPPGWCAT